MPIAMNVFETLRDDILDGRLPQGRKLVETQLSKTYGVSRTPIRSALVRLEICGLVENIPNRGAYVSGFSKQEYEDMITLRILYEVQAVKWAIERATEEDIEELKEKTELMEFYTMKKDIAKMIKINNQFHQKIIDIPGSKMLTRQLSNLHAILKERNVDLYTDQYMQDILREHLSIYKAFVNRDIEAGVEAVENHIKSAIVRAKSIQP